MLIHDKRKLKKNKFYYKQKRKYKLLIDNFKNSDIGKLLKEKNLKQYNMEIERLECKFRNNTNETKIYLGYNTVSK